MLKKRWFYIALLVSVVAIHVRLVAMGYHAHREGLVQPSTSERLAEMEHRLTPERLMAIAREQPGRVAFLGLLGLGMLGMLLAGVIRNIWLVSAGRLTMWWHGGGPLPSSWSFKDIGRLVILVVFLLSLLPMAQLGWAVLGWPGAEDRHLWAVAGMLALDGFLLLSVRALARSSGQSFRQAFGLAPEQWAAAVKRGLTGYVTMVPWLAALLWLAGAVCVWLKYVPPPEPMHELLFLESRTGMTVLTLALACVLGPIAEELFFRGVVFSSLRKRMPFAAAMLISGALFSALHANLVGFVPILVLGCFLAWLYERTGSLASSIAVHVIHNGVLVGMALSLKSLAA